MCKVMQTIETGEVVCAFEGSEDQCWDWIYTNHDQYPESTFFVDIPGGEYVDAGFDDEEEEF